MRVGSLTGEEIQASRTYSAFYYDEVEGPQSHREEVFELDQRGQGMEECVHLETFH